MNTKENLEKQVMSAARENNINSVLFRNSIRRKLGLNMADSECLSFLSIRGVSTPKEIAHYTGLTTGSTTTMLGRLEGAGFIRREPNPHDRRGVLVAIDGTWTERVGPLVEGVQKAQAELVSSYSEEELEIIADFLIRFTDNVKGQTQKIDNDLT
jgi:DNA-binding MarR family transcriptional regulator